VWFFHWIWYGREGAGHLTKITQTGVFVKKASLPKGKHKLLMVVEDTSSRKGNRVIEFVVQ
jgi:hypothetical protein